MDIHRNKKKGWRSPTEVAKSDYPDQMKTQEVDEMNFSNRSSIQIQIKLEESVFSEWNEKG